MLLPGYYSNCCGIQYAFTGWYIASGSSKCSTALKMRYAAKVLAQSYFSMIHILSLSIFCLIRLYSTEVKPRLRKVLLHFWSRQTSVNKKKSVAVKYYDNDFCHS
jgi:hypothetical protein